MRPLRQFPTPFLLAGVATLAACGQAREEMGTESPVSATVGEQFVLGQGEQAMFEGEGFNIRFVSVPEDSRCPVGTQCPWAGNARVEIRIVEAAQPTEVPELNTAVEPRSVTYKNYQIQLIDLAPQPEAERAVPQQAYRVTLRVVSAGGGAQPER